MNSLYHWHNEVMVATRMADTEREMISIRLLHDAGLSNPGLFERTAITVGKSLVKLGERLHRKYTEPRQAYQINSSKFAA